MVAICRNQLFVINKGFEIDLIVLNNEISSGKNHDKIKSYYITFSHLKKIMY